MSFWTEESSDKLGIMADLSFQYDYSEELYFRVGWQHLFAGDGLKEGSFTDQMGTMFMGGTGDEDPDYFFFDTRLKF